MLQNTKLYLYIFMLSLPSILVAAPECEKWIAKMVSTKGRVEKQGPDQSDWRQVKKDEYFCQGDKVRTKKHSRATLELGNESLLTLGQRSALAFPTIEKGTLSWILELFQGAAFFRSRSPHQLKIDTPFVNAVHEGTEFMVAVTEQQTEISVFDGRVAAENKAGRVQIDKGQIGIAVKGQITRVQALTLHPKDAVQWALYYPPIIDYQALGSIPTIPAIQQSLNFYQQGDVHQALSVLDNIPEKQQDEHYFGLKASLLLTVGSVDEALQEIERAQHLKATSSTALAIKAIIAVTKNHGDEALKLAQKATELNPSSAVAKIALSYAYQATFKIPEALQATEQAVQLAPNNALAWARLAELQLSSGERSDALESAQKAQQLNPQLDRTQTILGFAYLAQIDIAEAKTAFTQAIDLNSADPLARLGLGLAKIRKGAVEEGARDLETAVSLDPDNAIMRSYLGKAYYELRNEGYAATELAIAKDMDPNDPTPWFYDAILKQTTNRPVEALHDMQKAIELNDNRGIYRSKLLLDEDLAARSASLGRIYNDLGFQQLGLVEGWKSVTTDPSNYSAHRLLADNYAVLPRQEIARVSSLLQSQLLQPINITPIQPRLAESNKLVSNTLGNASFNEYNSLFERNQLTLQGSGIIGNNDSYGDELVHSGIWNRLSYSFGQYHFKTDGIRKNNFTKQDIYTIFAQYLFSDKLNLQLEYRYNDLRNGDLSQQFDPKLFSPTLKESFRRNSIRLGGKYHPDTSTNILFSAIYSSDKFSQNVIGQAGDVVVTENKAQTYNVEIQYLKETKFANFNFGGGYINSNQPEKRSIAFEIPAIPRIFVPGIIDRPAQPARKRIIRTTADFDSEHSNAYAYAFLKYNNLNGILGISYDSYKNKRIPNVNQFNPKIGLMWDLSKFTTLRAAWFKSVKRPFSSNQTIEPIQVAGFTQYFDDLDGTRAESFGVGLDQKFGKNLFGGIEWLYRKLDIPVILVTNNLILTDHERQNNNYIRSYLNWTPTEQLSVSVGYQVNLNDRILINKLSPIEQPVDVLTHIVPMSIRYFFPNGIYSNFQTTFVKQRVKDTRISNSGNEHFWSLDTLIGYKLPKRYGRIEFGVRNLLNENYQYQSISEVTGLDKRPQFLPERTMYFKFIFDFDY